MHGQLRGVKHSIKCHKHWISLRGNTKTKWDNSLLLVLLVVCVYTLRKWIATKPNVHLIIHDVGKV